MTKELNEQLLDAVMLGKIEEVKFLIEKGADVNAKNDYDCTAFELAVIHNHIGMIKFLVENGADGVMNLTLAAAIGHLEMVKLLIEYGADIDERDDYDITPLIAAAYNGRIETVKFLIENGADINAKNIYGNTALMLTECPKIKKTLKQAGAK